MNSKRNRKLKPCVQQATNVSQHHDANRPSALPTPEILMHQFLQNMRMRNCSLRTIHHWKFVLRRFVSWCEAHGVECLSQLTSEHLAAYQRNLFHYRNPRTGQPLKFGSQASYLNPIRKWLIWMFECQMVPADITDKLELPKEEKRLPTGVLTSSEVELLLNQPNLKTRLGIRDRAILETFYSTGIRCAELIKLDVYDVNFERQIVNVRLGKGQKDRLVPIGERALSWIKKYLTDIHPELVTSTNPNTLFVTKTGRRFHPTSLSGLVKVYMNAIGIRHRGSCHLLRHTAATLMMENGADLRALQMFLGHSNLNTTQIYTHVSIKRLQEVHRRTHPAKPNKAQPQNDKTHDE